MITLTVVEDQTILLESLSATIDAESDFTVVDKLTDAAEIHESVRMHPVDLVLMDVVTENSSGLVEAAKLRKNHPDLKIVIFTAMPDSEFVCKAQKAGVDSFVYKNVSTSDLLEVLRSTVDGKSTFPDKTRLAFFNGNELGEREMEVLRLVCAGYTRSQIADIMFLSENTIKSHISSLLAKSGFSSVARLALWAVSSDYVVVDETHSRSRQPGFKPTD